VVNGAAALYLGGAAESLKECAGRAEEAIDSGAASYKLEAFLEGAKAAVPGEQA
jgi:anthranilate phosphoribosyltransferase